MLIYTFIFLLFVQTIVSTFLLFFSSFLIKRKANDFSIKKDLISSFKSMLLFLGIFILLEYSKFPSQTIIQISLLIIVSTIIYIAEINKKTSKKETFKILSLFLVFVSIFMVSLFFIHRTLFFQLDWFNLPFFHLLILTGLFQEV
jgi:hypothetical protein